MAITHIEYVLIRRLSEEGLFPPNPSILELGQSNWYGDVPIEDFCADINQHVSDPGAAAELINQVKTVSSSQDSSSLFKLAGLFWKTFLGQHTYEAIDFDGVGDHVHKFDLNEPVPLDKQYDVVCNFGTAEHVFNLYQVFKTIHEHTKPGGLMLHGLPFQGWVDHGFYTFQPTFFFDLAEVNGYGSVSFLYTEMNPARIVAIKGRNTVHEMVEQGQVGKNAMLFCALRKPPQDESFKTPIQGYYARRLDKDAADRWMTLR